jgi:DNA-binding CsgD family transcriptional regulator
MLAFVDAIFDAYYDWNILTGSNQFSDRIDGLLLLEPGTMPRTYTGWLKRLHPADRQRAHQSNLRVVQQGGIFDEEYRMRRSDGSYIWVHDRGVIITDENGVSTNLVGAIRDITNEREAEQVRKEVADLYHTLFEEALNPAYHIGENGRFLGAIRAGLMFLGINRERLLLTDVSKLWGDAEASAAVQAVLTGSRSVFSIKLELHVGQSLKILAATLVPCLFRGQRTCFALGTDITEHETLRKNLEASEQSLRSQAAALEDVDTALRVILDQRNRDRDEFERSIAANAETMILPLLRTLLKRLLAAPDVVYIDAAMQNLKQLVHPFAQALDELTIGGERLTRREREIATMVRAGKSSREIAEALFVSPSTVAVHRKNLRRKLGLESRCASLAKQLVS